MNGADGKYDPGQRAYVFNLKSAPVSFLVDASRQSPVENLCFVLKQWNDVKKASVTVNGNKLADGKDFRQGVIRDINGSKTLVIWIEKESSKSMRIEINEI